MDSWLICSFPDRAVQVRALAGDTAVVLSGKTLYSHSASLHPGVEMGTCELLGKPNKLQGVTCDGLASRPGGSRNTPSRFMVRKPGQALAR